MFHFQVARDGREAADDPAAAMTFGGTYGLAGGLLLRESQLARASPFHESEVGSNRGWLGSLGIAAAPPEAILPTTDFTASHHLQTSTHSPLHQQPHVNTTSSLPYPLLSSHGVAIRALAARAPPGHLLSRHLDPDTAARLS